MRPITRRSKRAHASDGNSTSLGGGVFAMNYQPILEDYLKLMETIKIRQALVSDLTQNFHGLPPFCIAETIHLQIRLIYLRNAGFGLSGCTWRRPRGSLRETF
jgi:hypothetical protein